jgi:hypothetical protein
MNVSVNQATLVMAWYAKVSTCIYYVKCILVPEALTRGQSASVLATILRDVFRTWRESLYDVLSEI